MFQEVLKQATEKQHQLLEQSMFVNQIMDLSLNLVQYQDILLTNYIVHASFEDALFTGINPSIKQQLQLESRKKLPALLHDLQEAGLSTPHPDNINQRFFFKGKAEILGALYVLEGATLGGSVIVRRLKINPNLQELNLNFNYYQVYGKNLIPNWKQFIAVLNTEVSAAEYQQSINAALKLFNFYADIQKQNADKQSIVR